MKEPDAPANRASEASESPWMIPGDRGKAGPGWLALPLRSAGAEALAETGTIHQFLWRRSRAVSDAKQGLCGEERSEAALSRVK